MNESAPFDRRLLRWYRAHGRHELPWRLTPDPYAVLVSEVMLQQTQVSRVLPYYETWMARWPAVSALASATPAEVIRAWAGLGYNRRALALQRCAVAIAAAGGDVPLAPELLQQLPGVGLYTAAAVASFAGERRVAVLDTNIARVLGRARLGVASVGQAHAPALRAVASDLLPRTGRAARDHNLALMDLGAMVCTARAPACGACPLARGCVWFAAGAPGPALRTMPAPPFAGTARFARGRIIAALRGAPSLTEAELREGLDAGHAARLGSYLAALERDGLIVRSAGGGDAWMLPEVGGT